MPSRGRFLQLGAASAAGFPLMPGASRWTTPVMLVGLGSAAIKAVGWNPEGLVPVPAALAIDTSAIDLERSPIPDHVHLAGGLPFGVGGNAGLARDAALRARDELIERFLGVGVVVIVAGMGGGTGGGAGPVVAAAARTAGALVIGIPLMPFAAEGERRNTAAELALVDLREEAEAVSVLKYEDYAEERRHHATERHSWTYLDVWVFDQLMYLHSAIRDAWERAGSRPSTEEIFSPDNFA